MSMITLLSGATAFLMAASLVGGSVPMTDATTVTGHPDTAATRVAGARTDATSADTPQAEEVAETTETDLVLDPSIEADDRIERETQSEGPETESPDPADPATFPKEGEEELPGSDDDDEGAAEAAGAVPATTVPVEETEEPEDSSPSFDPGNHAPNGLGTETRLAGANRYKTPVQISRHVAGKSRQSNLVFIATGQDFPDALSIGALAAYTGSP